MLVICRTWTSVAPDGKVRVLATNLPAEKLPAERLGDLGHQRWRIEESYKRLKHRCKLESVSGLTQDAVLIDVYAKVLAAPHAGLIVVRAKPNTVDAST